MMYAMRSTDTPALLISDIMRPSIRTGQTSIELYEIKVTYSPAVISPRRVNTAPNTTTSSTSVPDSTSELDQ